jgi:hypothetical protein
VNKLAKTVKDEKAARKAIEAEAQADPEITYLAAWYHADDEKATPADVDKVRHAIRRLPNPEIANVLKRNVERLLIEVCVTGKGSRVVVENEVACMRKRYEYENLSELERAHVDRIVLCWLRVQRCEAERTAYDKGSHMISHVELAEKQLQLAHSRYMRALEQFAKVQFLMSRTNMKRLAAVREALKPQHEHPGKVIEMKAAGA